jgi:CubicO group peptidase (beta-lactamase class C family)
LFAFDEPVDRDVIADLDRLADVMARQRPAWEPGEQAYHAISLGFYEGELIRRVDPARRTLGRVFADALAAMNRRSVLHRSLIANPGTGFYLVPDRVVARNHEVSSAGGVSTARAIARAYGVFATGGAELGLRAETLEALKTPAIPARRGFFDECLRGPAKFSLGFMKPSESVRFGHDGAFGAPGAGGAMGYADPQLGIGYGYVTSRRGMHLEGDPRDVVLRNAIPAPGA